MIVRKCNALKMRKRGQLMQLWCPPCICMLSTHLAFYTYFKVNGWSTSLCIKDIRLSRPSIRPSIQAGRWVTTKGDTDWRTDFFAKPHQREDERERERGRGNMIGRTPAAAAESGPSAWSERENMYWKSIRLLVCSHEFMVNGSLSLSLPSTEFPYIDGLMARRCPPPSRSVCACWLAGGYAELCTRNRPLGNMVVDVTKSQTGK